MNMVIALRKPEGSDLGYKPLVLSEDERFIMENLLPDPHAVNDLLQKKLFQASSRYDRFDLRIYERLQAEVEDILKKNRDPGRKTSPVNVIVELRDAFMRIASSPTL